MIGKHTVAWLFVGVAAVPAVSGGYCNWGPLGTAASSTCDLEVEGGNWCNANQINCETGCTGKWCTNDGGGPVPPSSSPPPPPANCPAASNHCGPNNPCAGGLCCSKWGYCGRSEAHCGTCCQSNCGQTNPAPSPPPPPVRAPSPPPPPVRAPSPPPPANCPADSNSCGPNSPCADGSCCSQWGYCGTSDSFCGTCCQSNCGQNPAPTPTPPTPPTRTPPTNSPPTAPDTGATDSRLIAYVGNWHTCPTPQQTAKYTHIVVAFAVSYSWAPGRNNCDAQCSIASTVPICNNANNQALVDSWRAAGKKVILSFGGAGMGGSWSGDLNNCWDNCFGKEDTLSTNLVNIVKNQRFDGIDIDYEYCYDVGGSQRGRCQQRTNNYSDVKAQKFLTDMTSSLRRKLDSLGSGYEITHAPLDSDLLPSSKYYQILKAQQNNLDFLMPQFYNGFTRPHVDGVGGKGIGQESAISMFDNLANDMFDSEPEKVVFGFCISDCELTGSNTSANQAVQVMSDLKAYNSGEFACNGGAFLWVADDDKGGAWSGTVYGEVGITAGCSKGR